MTNCKLLRSTTFSWSQKQYIGGPQWLSLRNSRVFLFFFFICWWKATLEREWGVDMLKTNLNLSLVRYTWLILNGKFNKVRISWQVNDFESWHDYSLKILVHMANWKLCIGSYDISNIFPFLHLNFPLC